MLGFCDLHLDNAPGLGNSLAPATAFSLAHQNPNQTKAGFYLRNQPSTFWIPGLLSRSRAGLRSPLRPRAGEESRGTAAQARTAAGPSPHEMLALSLLLPPLSTQRPFPHHHQHFLSGSFSIFGSTGVSLEAGCSPGGKTGAAVIAASQEGSETVPSLPSTTPHPSYANRTIKQMHAARRFLTRKRVGRKQIGLQRPRSPTGASARCFGQVFFTCGYHGPLDNVFTSGLTENLCFTSFSGDRKRGNLGFCCFQTKTRKIRPWETQNRAVRDGV